MTSPTSQLRESCTGRNVIATYSLPLIFIWVIALYLGATRGLNFLSETNDDGILSRDPSSPGWVAARAVGEYFLQKVDHYPFSQAVVVTLKEPSLPDATVKSAAVANLTALVLNSTLGLCDVLPSANEDLLRACWWRQAHGIFVWDKAADFDEADYLSPDNRSATLIVLETNRGFGATGPGQLAAWQHLQAAIDSWLIHHGEEFTVGSTHEQMLLHAAQTRVPADFERGDLATLPIAFLILCWACGPPALLVLVTLPMTLLSSLYVLSQIATGELLCKAATCPGPPLVAFPSFAPALFINTVIALSFDYTLFFLSRYREECARATSALAAGAAGEFDEFDEFDHTSALVRTLRHAGRVIALSGVTLALCFVGLTFSTDKIIPALGWGGAVSCFVAVAVHLTLLPALLFFIGPCCGHFSRRCRRVDRPDRPGASATGNRAPLRAAGAVAAVGEASSARASGRCAASSERWGQLALLCQAHRLKIIGAAALLTAPLAFLSTQLRLTADQMQLTPRDSPALLALEAITRSGLSAGVLDPVRVVVYNRDVRGGGGHGCMDDNLALWDEALTLGLSHESNPWDRLLVKHHGCALFDLAYHVCNATLAPMVPWKDARGRVCYRPITPYVKRLCPGTCPNYCNALGANRSVLIDELFDLIRHFRAAVERALELPPSAIRDVASLPSNRSARLSAREAAALLQQKDGAYAAQVHRLANFNYSAAFIEVVLPAGQSGKDGLRILDQVRQITSAPPFSTSPFGFLVYGDVVHGLDAINAALSRAPTMLAVVSAIVIFFMAGMGFCSLLVPLRLLLTIVVTLVWVAGASAFVWQTLFRFDGLYWCVPLSCGCLVVGLTIDYDVFLVSRVHEFRKRGYTTQAAIVRAMRTQSDTITTAGVIMAVAFSSLLFSSAAVLNEFGLTLVVATLVDTFLVRTVLVPSLMFCAVDWNWWPGRMPPAKFDDHTSTEDATAPLQAADAAVNTDGLLPVALPRDAQ